MANEIIKDEVILKNVAKVVSSEANVQNKLQTDDEIVKVLSVLSEASILHTELLDGEGHFAGKLTTKVVFLDAQNDCHSIESETEFSAKCSSDLISATSFGCAKVNVDSTDIESVSSHEIVVNNALTIKLKLINKQGAQLVTDGSENVLVEKEAMVIPSITCEDKQIFEIELELSQKLKNERILSHKVSAAVKSIKTIHNGFCINGQVFASVLTSGSEPNDTKVIFDNADFNEEIVCSEVNESSKIDANLSILSSTIYENEGSVRIKLSVLACYNVNNTQELMVVKDAFSLTNEVNLNISSENVSKFFGMINASEEISGNAMVGNDSYEIRKVVGSIPKNLIIANKYVQNERIYIEGIASFTSVYVGVEDDVNSVDIELPFSFSINANGVNSEDMIFVKVNASDVNSKLRKANEIELMASLLICASVYKNETIAFVSDVEIREEKPECENALTLYIVKQGETLFDIAKKLSVTVDQIMEQNEGVTNALEEGMQIIIYKQKIKG